MKTWVIWLLVILFVFVVIPLIYFAIAAKSITKIVNSQSNDGLTSSTNAFIQSPAKPMDTILTPVRN